MKSANKYIVSILTVGFISLVILSTLLFWGREVCQAFLYTKILKRPIGFVTITPSSLVPELDSDPNVVRKSRVTASIYDDVVFSGLGFWQNISSLEKGQLGDFCVTNKYTGDKGRKGYSLVLFNKHTGLFVYYDVFKKKREWSKKAKFYAGPKGISETADKNLGRFSKPYKNLWRSYTNSFTFFDKSLSRFFQIRFYEQVVVKGTQLSKDYSPVQMGEFDGFDKNGGLLGYLRWHPPLRKETPQDKEEKKTIIRSWRDMNGQRINYVSAAEDHTGTYSKEETLVLDKSGEIRKLDNNTLELSGPIGFVPSAVDSVGRAKPEELFAYAVQPFVVNDEYSGTIAASISREAMEIQVAVFDKDGKLIERKGAHINPFSMAGGPALTILNYLIENLQPAFLGLVSYFTASSFEAASGHRALFILPNSFIGMFGRYAGESIIGRFFFALMVISPSVILGLLLACWVSRDAVVVGLSKRAKLYWVIGTILFGLSAYITYRLTRSKETLVTCINCGKMRRPDMGRCHRCRSKWHVVELTAPLWRVLE